MIHTIDDLLVNLRNAAMTKTEIAKRETKLWQNISRSLDKHVARNAALAAPPETAPAALKGYLNTDQAAEYLGISRTSLYRCKSEGLRYIKIGRSTRYKIEDLDAFVRR
jgi:excisionase family DNA binding protein